MKEEFSTQLGLVIFDPNLNGLKIKNFTVQNILLDDEGPCYGDGGGPLVASKGPNDESAVLFGIFSMDIDVWSNGTVRGCVNGITAVYTRVTKFLGWIRSHMEGTLQILLIRIFQTFVITTARPHRTLPYGTLTLMGHCFEKGSKTLRYTVLHCFL